MRSFSAVVPPFVGAGWDVVPFVCCSAVGTACGADVDGGRIAD